jgi:glycosyltransferase involved in cell wall biosynthesis
MTAKISQFQADISFVVPCYNEEEIIGYTLQRLRSAFDKAGHSLELVVVDNGSNDRTGEKIREFASHHPGVICHRVEINQGYGLGVLNGLPLCTAPWVGIIPADGQVDAEDVVRLYEAVLTTDGNVLGKVRRRFRMDGIYRKLVSTTYNVFVRVLWPTLQSIDINGSPKLLPADVVASMDLRSKGWLLDPEIMIKAHYMGLRVMELNVFSRMRGNGVSHVKAATCWEFLTNLLKFRFSREWRRNFEQISSQRTEFKGSKHAAIAEEVAGQ